MIKEMSQTQFSFKPRKIAQSSESYISNESVKYDSLISTILSKASFPSEIPLLQFSKNINKEDEALESIIEVKQDISIMSVKPNKLTVKLPLPKTPLISTKSHSKINNIRVVSYMKNKNAVESAKIPSSKTKEIFKNQTNNSKPKSKIPHPSLKTNSFQRTININVNVYIESSNNDINHEKKSNSFSSFSLNKEGNILKKHIPHRNLSKEREKRRISKSKIIAERKHSLNQICNKIDSLSGTIDNLNSKNSNNNFEENKENLINESESNSRFVFQNSIDSLDSYDNETN